MRMEPVNGNIIKFNNSGNVGIVHAVEGRVGVLYVIRGNYQHEQMFCVTHNFGDHTILGNIIEPLKRAVE